MRGSVVKRCGCRDGQGRQLGSRCPKLRTTGHGSWQYAVELPGPNGKRLRFRKAGFSSRGDADEALRALLARLDEGGEVDTRTTVDEFMTTWLAGKAALRPTSRLAYDSAIRNYIRPNLGSIPLDRLRTKHVSAMFAAMAAPAEGKPVGLPTQRYVRAVLRSALQTALRQRLITHNPAQYVELAAPPRRRVQPWTAEKLGQFLDHSASDRLGPLYELLAMTGLRRGEALGLRWCDVDLDERVLSVVQQLIAPRGKLAFGPPKTASGEYRKVDLDSGTVGTLLAWQLRQGTERAAFGSAYVESGLVFTRENGEPLRPEYVSRRFQQLTKAAELPVVRLHMLRHGAASLQLAANVPMAVVSKRLGHSQTSFTSDT